ncbi:hypothetical protein HDU79_006678 [Rhizoclosmatium sp. JEL0117]|nr:hypothetical protein HDU79_006678 [Rhizoclosmatium sp. JEL0117]
MNISMNGVVALVDGNTGNMLASSYPNATYNDAAGTAYTAMGNPHKLISKSVSVLATNFGSFQTLQSIPRSPEPIITSYNNGQDVILINAVWISDLSSGLNWFLVLAIPSSDLSTVVKDGMKGAIISVVVLSVFAIGVAALFAWLIMTPIKKITNGMQEATLLDFSRMREGYLQERNFVYEIGTLQYIFHKLLYEVVDIVRKNEMMEAAIKEKGLGTTLHSTHSINRNSSTAAPSTAPHVLRLSRGVAPSNSKLDIKD